MQTYPLTCGAMQFFMQQLCCVSDQPYLMFRLPSYELVAGRPPDVAHIRTFGCQVWVPVTEPKRHTIGAHRQEGIYIGFDSASIIKYLDPQSGAY